VLADFQWCRDWISHLKAEHSHEVKTLRETAIHEARDLKSLHEKELADVRKLLNETTQHRTEFENQHRQLLEETEDVFRWFLTF
jgi:hypothetical protein